MGTLETLTPDGSAWPAAFTAPKNGEVYDAADDEACHQAAADAAAWLKERATRIQDQLLGTDGSTYTGSIDWQDTGIYTSVQNQTAGDVLTAWVEFTAVSEANVGSSDAQFRIKFNDGTDSYSPARPMLSPNGSEGIEHFCLVGQRHLAASGNVTITLQVKNSNTAVQTSVASGTILPIVERRKADDT